MKKFAVLTLVLFFLIIFTKNTDAKTLPQAVKTGQKQTTAIKNAVGTGISVSPSLRRDRRALIVNFANLQNAQSVSYLLTYKTGVQDEGARGTLTLGGSTKTTEQLLFGTCSKNVCTYHTNISNARLEVSYTSKTGKKYLKKYKIKV